MKRLVFKSRYIEPILSGTKRATIRRHKPVQAEMFKTRYEPGELLEAICRYNQPPFAQLRVVEYAVIGFDDLTEADALADGFKSLTEMHQTLLDLLPNAREVPLARIRFEKVTV